jgi:hypothetical protein
MAVLEDIDIGQLAQEARELGYNTKEQVVNRLMRKLARDQGYVKRRIATGRAHLSHTETTAEDALVLALAIEMLQKQ